MTLDVKPINRRLLIGSEAWLCIAQLTRAKSELGSENRNQHAADLIAALLRCDAAGRAPIDQDCENDELTRILLLPELALGFEDLAAVENAVKSYNKPILVLSGAGFAKASELRAHVDFLGGVSDKRNVNFGCVWINFPATHATPATYQLHFHCKNFIEQRGEVPGFDPVLGSRHVVFEFEDCSIAPLICSDVLAETQQGKENAIDQLRTYRLGRNRPVIVAASVLQDAPWHDVWSSRIDRVVDSNFVLLLANFAHECRPKSYPHDINRNLSGAYIRTGLVATAPLETFACSARTNSTAKGTILRDSCETLAAGILRVDDFSATTGRHLWIVRWGQSFTEGEFTPSTTRLQYEIPRLFQRTHHLTPANTVAISEVMAHLQNASDDRKKSFFLSIADGPDAKQRDPDPAGTSEANSATELALCAVDALARTPYFRWPADESPTIELRIPQAQNIPSIVSQGYVWKSASDTWSTMVGRLESYAQQTDPRPALVVFGEDASGTEFDAGYFSQPDTTAPQTHDIDFAAPRSTTNTVIAMPLSKAKRLSSEVSNAANFNALADSIRDSIIEATGLGNK